MLKNIMQFLIRPISYSKPVDLGILIIRIASGGLMLLHGWPKLKNFNENAADFYDFLGLGFTASLSLVIFAEFFCAIMIAVGLLTRLANIPLLFTMGVILIDIKAGSPFNEMEVPLIYAACFLALLITGAGKYSLDYLIFAKRESGKY